VRGDAQATVAATAAGVMGPGVPGRRCVEALAGGYCVAQLPAELWARTARTTILRLDVLRKGPCSISLTLTTCRVRAYGGGTTGRLPRPLPPPSGLPCVVSPWPELSHQRRLLIRSCWLLQC
jgi:hypothetical protein